ncbi:response regulator [Thermodesulfobacteriota bacterium]
MGKLDILVVEDDPGVRKLLKKRLTKSNYEVETAEDGVSAVDMISKSHFDVVLTDLLMPGSVDGIGVLDAIKKNNLRTEVIIITAFPSIDNAIEALKKGAIDYLQKPINFDELLIRLDKISGMKKLLKNASDLRDAMNVTETVSAQTIRMLEMEVSNLEGKLAEIRKVLSQNDVSPEERIKLALEK